MDKSALDAMGNCYADEVLWEAKLHPKTMVRSLTDAQLDALHDAIVGVLTNARDVIAKRQPPLDEKLRDFVKVRGRNGEPCPRCGTKLRSAGVHGHDADFCPQCQPDGRASSIVDWRKIPPKG
jgi:formamidopyrimidine-DNA glycosylase